MAADPTHRDRTEHLLGQRMAAGWWLELRTTLRALTRRPGLAATVILVVALGVGLVTAMVTVAHATLVRGLPFPEADELVFLTGVYEDAPLWSLSLPELADIDERMTTVGPLGAYSSGHTVTWTGDGEARTLTVGYASSAFFDVLGTPPRLGRTFERQEDQGVGAHPVAIATEAFWTQALGGGPDALERRLDLNGTAFSVVGVLPADFHIDQVDLWLPMTMGEGAFGPGFDSRRRARFQFAVARLVDGSGLDAAQRELGGVMEALRTEYPTEQEGRGAELWTLRRLFYGDVQQPIQLLSIAAAMVLLVCVVNVAALLLVRAAARRQEMALRAALGASRLRVAAGLLCEGLLLTAAGGALGIVFGQAAVRLTLARFDLGLPAFTTLELDLGVLATCLLVVAAAAVATSLYPAWRHRRTQPSSALRAGGSRSGAGRGERRQRSLVVALEVAAAVALLIAGALTVQSFVRLTASDLGFDPHDLLTLQLDLRGPAFQSADSEERTRSRAAFVDRFEEEAAALPGVRSAVTWGPGPLAAANRHFLLVPPGHDPEREDHRFFTQLLTPGDGALADLGIELRAGREFTAADTIDAPRVAMIDEELADSLWDDEDPVGSVFLMPRSSGDTEPVTVVGVVRSVRHRGARYDEAADGVWGDVYLPAAQVAFGQPYVLVRLEPGHAPAHLVPALRRAAAAIDGSVALSHIETVDDRLDRAASTPRFAATLMAAFAAIGALLAVVGTYGLLAFAAAARRSEIAVRAALGARRDQLVRMVIREGMTPVLVGVGLGLLTALGASRWLSGLLFEVRATDPATYGVAAALLLAAALAACWLPARKVAATEPSAVLRHD